MNNIIYVIYLFLLVPILTCIIEIPIVKLSHITNNISYIIAINFLTNIPFNVITLFLDNNIIYTYIMELLIIPIIEAILYMCISSSNKIKLIIVSYIANICSWLIGTFIL